MTRTSRSSQAYLDRLAKVYRSHGLTLYLGAGVSVASGLPTWEQLVLAMYFATAEHAPLDDWRPYSNYLYAISEWFLARRREPLEITARKIRLAYTDAEKFRFKLWETLYAAFAADGGLQPALPRKLRQENTTLRAVTGLCEHRTSRHRGVTSVITYNYDGLLEAVLRRKHHPVWRPEPVDQAMLPIYHVHGFVSLQGEGSTPEEIVFTEDQYHRVAQDPYSWGNIVQLRCMTASVGLMVGMSLSDRNIRRLLDAASRTPVKPEIYALLQRPQWKAPEEPELKVIDAAARKYYERFEKSSRGIKRSTGRPGIKDELWQQEITGIVKEVENLDLKFETRVLNELGIYPIWYSDHTEIPALIAQVIG